MPLPVFPGRSRAEKLPQSSRPLTRKTVRHILLLILVVVPKHTSRCFRLLLAGLLYLLPALLCAQDTIQLDYTDISQIHLEEPSRKMRKKIASAYIGPEDSLPAVFQQLRFTKGVVHPIYIPSDHVTKKIAVRFNLCNSADSAQSVWFFPGLYFWKVQLYKLQDNGQLEQLPSIMPKEPAEISYRKLTLQPHDSCVIVAELTQVRTHLNGLRPRLIHPEYLQAAVITLDNSNIESKVFTYVFCGLLMMMILFSLANYFMNRNAEFLYYAGYAFFLGLMLFIKGIYSYHSSDFGFFQEGYLDFIMQSVGCLLYMPFMQTYLATRTRHPFLHRLYNFGMIMLVGSMIAFTLVHYFTWNFALENYIENIAKGLLLIIIFVFLVYSIRRWEDRLLRYLFWGNFCLFFFSLFSLLMLTGNIIPRDLPAIFKSSIFYYELGILLELIFFLMGLNYKNRRQLIAQAQERERLKAENLMNEYEREIAVYKGQQEERERISADMHDELGSGMTAIRLMSEIARNKMKENTPIEIEKISRSADEVLNKMNAIIWSMNSGNDSVDNLVSYIRSYALEYFENTPIACRIYTPETISERELSGDKRRNLFLCVKETLNNALKHSKASEIRIYFMTDEILTIKIVDNGVGIDLQKIRKFGNGLKNIAKRMESIGGSYQIENNNGTVTTLRLPL